MAFAFERNQLGVKPFGQNVTIPNNPKAKLMYYLNCMATVRKYLFNCHKMKVRIQGATTIRVAIYVGFTHY